MNRFEQWTKESKARKERFAKGDKFAAGEMKDIGERVETRRQEINDA
jgi:hypothetical protein